MERNTIPLLLQSLDNDETVYWYSQQEFHRFHIVTPYNIRQKIYRKLVVEDRFVRKEEMV